MEIRRMAVPKAPVDENHGAVFFQYYVRSARHAFYIFAETVSPVVKIAPYDQLGPCVPAFDTCHYGRAFFLVPNVHGPAVAL